MSEVTNEVMENETMEIEGPMETEVTDYTEDSNGESGKSLATILEYLFTFVRFM